jgi:hypothetical protein
VEENEVMFHCQSVCQCMASVVRRGHRLQFPSFPNFIIRWANKCIVYAIPPMYSSRFGLVTRWHCTRNLRPVNVPVSPYPARFSLVMGPSASESSSMSAGLKSHVDREGSSLAVIRRPGSVARLDRPQRKRSRWRVPEETGYRSNRHSCAKGFISIGGAYLRER